ncbi:MAG: response regulator [Polyangiaceae bacterium]
MGQLATPTEKRKIVVAEDDTEMRALLSEMMRRDGYEVREVKDGRELLLVLEDVCLRGIAPDLIVSDIRMPGYTGLELLWAMREADIVLPVILITAFSDRKVRDRARRGGAILVDKPLDFDDLRRIVRKMVP